MKPAGKTDIWISLQQGGMIKETWMEEDPREAILKYADAAEKDPKYIAPAYAQTQPDPVFAKSDSEDEEKWSKYDGVFHLLLISLSWDL